MWKTLVLCAALAACGSSTEPKVVVGGVYALVSIGGQSLPVQTEDAESTRVVSGSITLVSDGVFSVTETDSIFARAITPPQWRQILRKESGTWTQVGSIVYLDFPSVSVVVHVVGSDELDWGSGRDAWRYRR